MAMDQITGNVGCGGYGMIGKRIFFVVSLLVALSGVAGVSQAVAQSLEEVETICSDSDDIDECADAADALIDSDADASERAAAYRARGLRYHDETGHETQAVADYTAALKIKPSANVYFNRALLLRQGGKVDEALADLQKAVELRPNYGKAWIDISLILGNRGEHAEAIVAARNAVERDAELDDEFKSMAWNNIGNDQLKSEQVAEAKDALEKAIDFNPQNASAHRNLVRVHIRLKDKPHAEDILKIAEKLDPGSPFNADLRAYIAELD